MHIFIWILVAIFYSLSWPTDASKIVVYQFPPPIPNSPFMMLDALTKELAARGHTLMVITADNAVAGVVKSKNVVLETYPAPQVVAVPKDTKKMARAKFIDKYFGPQPLMAAFLGRSLGECDAIVNNITLVQRVKDFGADVFVHATLMACPKVIAAKAKIPVVSVHPSFAIEAWLNSWNRGSPFRYLLPNPIAYNPQLRLGAHHPLTFLQRIRNSFLYFTSQLITTFAMDQPVLALLRRQGVDLSTPGAYGRDAMLLVNANFAVEQPRPLPPHVKMVGPILVTAPQPLPPDLQAYMEESENGVVLVAAGTIMPLDQPQLLEMGRALSRLPVRVLWKLSQKDIPDQAALEALGLADNVKVVTWLPQNDLLAHNKTRAFVSHCGINSLYEGLWHGVPIVGLPGMVDQPDNAWKAAHHGAGIALSSMFEVTEGQLFDAVMRVLEEPSFKQNAQKVAKRLRSQKRRGPEEAADWIEHVADTGGEPYLRPPIDELSFLARHSIDVTAFWAACVGIPTQALLRWLLRRKMPRGFPRARAPKND